MRLLIVDDSPLDRALVRELATQHGADVLEADGGQDALDVAANADVILLDGHIPGDDVPTIAARLRAEAPHARIVLWSGMPDDIVPLLGDGDVDAVVRKPEDLDALEDALLGGLLAAA